MAKVVRVAEGTGSQKSGLRRHGGARPEAGLEFLERGAATGIILGGSGLLEPPLLEWGWAPTLRVIHTMPAE